MHILVLTALVFLVGNVAHAGGVTCTTRYDRAFDRQLTRCSDGRAFVSKYDKDFQTWRTREAPPWKRVEPKGKER